MKNLTIERVAYPHDNCLKFIFRNEFTKDQAEEGIEIWKKVFHSKPDEKFTLIWHCLEMKGYEPSSRRLWQQAMKELKAQIECIWLVSNSKVIKYGASLMSLFTSFEIKTVHSEDEIMISQSYS